MQPKRELLISKGWMQAVAIVGLCGFLILGILAYRTYTDEPPIPSKVLGSDGPLLFTGEDITAGQEVFLKDGLMEYGSIFGHGAYLGPDFTADYLHRAALIADEHYGGSSSDSARQQTIADFKANRYDGSSGVLTYSAAQTDAFNRLLHHYGDFLPLRTRETDCGPPRSRTRSRSLCVLGFSLELSSQLASMSTAKLRELAEPARRRVCIRPSTL